MRKNAGLALFFRLVAAQIDYEQSNWYREIGRGDDY